MNDLVHQEEDSNTMIAATMEVLAVDDSSRVAYLLTRPGLVTTILMVLATTMVRLNLLKEGRREGAWVCRVALECAEQW